MSNRIVRINELVQREISDILRRRHGAEAVAITVSEVRVAPDLRDGRVFVAIVGSQAQVEDRFKWLKGRSREIREELARRITIKFIPRLTYVLDMTADRAARIHHALNQIAEEGAENGPVLP